MTGSATTKSRERSGTKAATPAAMAETPHFIGRATVSDGGRKQQAEHPSSPTFHPRQPHHFGEHIKPVRTKEDTPHDVATPGLKPPRLSRAPECRPGTRQRLRHPHQPRSASPPARHWPAAGRSRRDRAAEGLVPGSMGRASSRSLGSTAPAPLSAMWAARSVVGHRGPVRWARRGAHRTVHDLHPALGPLQPGGSPSLARVASGRCARSASDLEAGEARFAAALGATREELCTARSESRST